MVENAKFYTTIYSHPALAPLTAWNFLNDYILNANLNITDDYTHFSTHQETLGPLLVSILTSDEDDFFQQKYFYKRANPSSSLFFEFDGAQLRLSYYDNDLVQYNKSFHLKSL